jgi:hypothetical protein
LKVRYVGKSFGVESLTNGRVYECIEIVELGLLRIIDDSGEPYLYSPTKPASLDNPKLCGKWEIVEDNENKDLEKIIK